jgi:hypothetical protein
MSRRRFGRYSVELSHTDKLLFPDSGISKGQLIGYYREVADVMLLHLEDRPLTLHRFPDGIDQPGFYQQESSDYFPDWIRTRRTPRADDGDAVQHVLCNNQAMLVYLANQAVVSLHGWLARAAHHPPGPTDLRPGSGRQRLHSRAPRRPPGRRTDAVARHEPLCHDHRLTRSARSGAVARRRRLRQRARAGPGHGRRACRTAPRHTHRRAAQ